MRPVRLAALPPPAPYKAKLLANLASPGVVLGFPHHVLALKKRNVDRAACDVTRLQCPSHLTSRLRATDSIESRLLLRRPAALDDLES